ncbi:MAG TPA: peptide chain release factor N(5)-glutamine methyltransferase [Candidatus Methylacidiphilales bacterium]|jgi:release factor glutamine methyltransferase|nr:peptide chain release factor N(5)-glutamine methyltransferase [Candidatus Methylacidiphilales bacterium]
MTVLELIENTTRYFAKHEVASPRLTIELMLAEIMQKTRMQLYLEFDQPVSDPVMDRLRPLVRRRAEGEPLEYLLGATTFAGHRVAVTPDVLIPRPETEILLDEAVKLIEPEGLPVLDVGTGSGILALGLARKFPRLEIVATDISPAALALARSNAERNGDGAGKIRFLESDLMEEASLPERFQMIVANLPYIPTGQIDGLMREVRHEPRMALDGGADGLDLIRRLVAQSAGRTRFLALELGDGQAEEAKTLCLSAGYALIRILPDFTERARILIAEYQEQTWTN